MSSEKQPTTPPLVKDLIALFEKNPTAETVLKIVQTAYPEINKDVLPSLVGFKVGLCYPRKNTGIYLPRSWEPSRRDYNNGFSSEAQVQWFKQVIASIGEAERKGISLDVMQFIPTDDGIPRFDWSLGHNLSNFSLSQNLDSLNQFKAPPLSPTTTASDFTVKVYPVVVNPDMPSQIWSYGDEFEIPSEYASLSEEAQQNYWHRLLESNREQLMEEFGFEDVPSVFHQPQIALRWCLVSPDGEIISKDRISKTDWRRNPSGAVWFNEKTKAMEEAYGHAMIEIASRFTHKALSACRFTKTEPWEPQMTELQWNYMGFTQPKSDEDYNVFMDFIKRKDKERFKSMVSSTVGLIFDQMKEKDALSVLALPELRDQVMSINWLPEESLQDYIGLEKEYVSTAFDGVSKKEKTKLKQMTTEWAASADASKTSAEMARLLDILAWNQHPFVLTSSVQEVLNPVFVSVVENVAPIAEEKSKKQFISKTDWSDLFHAFNLDPKQVKELSGDISTVHPFSRWMERLSPPLNVEEKTNIWLLDNQTFNAVNRLILREKENDNLTLNTQLAEKLKNVLDVSTKILQENRQNNGWFGRLSKNFKEGVSSDTWADAFMDFQKHMIVMYSKINEQVERDRLWLKYADNLIDQSSAVDTDWSSWLSQSAQKLEEERNSKPNASGEEKMIWNEKINVLASSNVAHDHIRTANAVTSVLLEKVRQSIQIKERLQQRSMMFYWSSLSMFAGLQSLQRNADGLMEQSEFVEEMKKSFNNMTSRSLIEEQAEKEKIREAFKNMATSKESVENFYKKMAEYQQETVTILRDLNNVRIETQQEAVESLSATNVAKKRKQKAKALEIEINTSAIVSAKSTGPK